MKQPFLLELTRKYNKSLAQISLRWAYQKDFIVIPKSKTEDYIKENFQIEDFNIQQDDMLEIDKLNIGLHTCWDPETIKY
jgi:diketogulonate reductase-like aldo/keto reductase